jgi:hypothetical protein
MLQSALMLKASARIAFENRKAWRPGPCVPATRPGSRGRARRQCPARPDAPPKRQRGRDLVTKLSNQLLLAGIAVDEFR